MPSALKKNGELWTWGPNALGTCGDNTTDARYSPVQVVGNHSFIYTVGNDLYMHALKSDGSCWGWGYNYEGQLGNDSVDVKSSPVQVVGNHSFIKVAVGGYITFGLKADGSAWAWGRNDYGNIGNNTDAVNYSSPVQVVGNHSFLSICPGIYSTYGLKSDGSVWSWGYNNLGELGHNDQVDKSSPVQVIGNHSFVKVAPRAYGTMYALKNDGTIWGTGYVAPDGVNYSSYSSPVLISFTGSYINLVSSINNSYALKSNGEVWSWGYNDYGQLGDNTGFPSDTPVLVAGGHSFMSIVSDYTESARALKANGEVWTWGSNLQGALGVPPGDKSSPVLVTGSQNWYAIKTGMNVSLDSGSTWIKRPVVYIKQSGAWHRVLRVFTKSSGVWKTTDREHL